MAFAKFNAIVSPTFVVAFQSFIAVCGLIVYILFFITLLKNRSRFLKNTFWILTLHLFFVDCLYLIVALLYELPCVYFSKQVYPVVIADTFANLNMIFYNTILMMMVLMSVDRFVKVVVQGNLLSKFDSPFFIHILACFCWVIAIVVIAIIHFSGCKKIYMEKFYRYYFICQKSNYIITILNSFSWLNIGLLILLYTLIFIYIKCKRVQVRYDYCTYYNMQHTCDCLIYYKLMEILF